MKLELKWVAIIFVVHIIWQVIERLAGLYSDNFKYADFGELAFLLVYAFMMLLAISNVKSKNRGFLNRRHGFLSGLFISFILTALAPLMIAILAFLIQPGFFDVMRSNALDAGEYQAYQMAANEYSYWSYVKLYMAGYLLVGSLSGALWSFLLHKMPEPVTD